MPKTTFKIISVSAFEVSLRNSTLNIFSSEELPPSVIQIEAYVKDLKKTVLIAQQVMFKIPDASNSTNNQTLALIT